MKNLIGLFFVLSALNGYTQNTKEEIVALNKVHSISKKHKVDTMAKKMVIKQVELEDKKELESIQNIAPNAIKTDILKGFSSGNATLLSKYFPSNIDISILGKSNLYSKSQAQRVLSTFFTQNKPSNFNVVHEGQSNGTKYFIGTYNAGTSKYRVTVNVKSTSGAEQISSISIER